MPLPGGANYLGQYTRPGTPWDEYDRAYADALMKLVGEVASGGKPGPGGGGSSVKATVVVRAEPGVLEGSSDAPGELRNGSFVPAGVVRGLAENGRVKQLDLTGVRFDTEQMPEVVRRWVWDRDKGRCRGIDCATPTLHLEIHHLRDRRAEGLHHHPSNALCLCWVCHQVRFHREGWRIIGDAERKIQWIKPDGSVYTPPPRARPMVTRSCSATRPPWRSGRTCRRPPDTIRART